ncbi:MAG: hypothetical protein WC124_02230 [Desulfoplanes sp.]
MQYDPSNKILTMSQTDAEHCGFDWHKFRSALFLAGMSVPEADAVMDAYVIVVSMHNGVHK